MSRNQIHFLFLNIAHFYNHLFLLVFATAAAFSLTREWNMSYAELIPYSVPAFLAFGLGAIPAGWIADKWSRPGMMVIFFVGIGAASSLTALAESPAQISASLLLIGMFASIYHPVGLAMVVEGHTNTGVPIAVNGIFGNMGVASAPLIAGAIIDLSGWRLAYLLPGVVAVITGIAYLGFVLSSKEGATYGNTKGADTKPVMAPQAALGRSTLIRVFIVIFFTTALGGFIFQSTTFALPKILAERLSELAPTATAVGSWAFLVFAVAAFAQLVVGYLVDNYPIRTVFAVVAGLQTVFFIGMAPLYGVAALLVSLAFMLAVFGQIPINDVLVGRMTRTEWRSRAYAARYVITFTVSATAIPSIAWLYQQWGFAALFLVLSVLATCIFLAVLTLPRTKL